MRTCVFLLALLLTSCHGFKNPPFKKGDLIEIPGVEGTWKLYPATKDSAALVKGEFAEWEILQTDKNQYTLRETSDRGTTLIGHFFDISGQDFLSLQYVGTPQQTFPQGHLYTVMKIDFSDSLVVGTLINIEYLVYLSKAGFYSIKYETVHDKSSEYNTGASYLILEPTSKVRQLLKKFKEDEKVFPDELKFIMTRSMAAKP